MNNPFGTLSVLLVLLAQSTILDPSSGAISLVVTRLRNDKGQMGCRLFNAAKGFPVDEAAALQIKWGAISNRESYVNFDPVAPGVYAVACFHDENGKTASTI